MRKEYLMTPGPTPVPSEVLLAQARPMIHHRAPIYTEVLLGVLTDLKYVFQTGNEVLIYASSGTGGMESAVVNLFSRGDKVVVVSTGNFGERWAKISDAYGLNVTKLDYEWGTKANPQDVADLLEKDSEIKGILATHSETSTGVLNDIEEMGRIVSDYPAVLVVDAISGLGACELKTDEWKVDVVVAGSQKALMTPPGLSFVSVSDKAWAMVEKSTLPKFYFDWGKTRDALHKPSPQSPFTPAISTMLGLSEALKAIREETLEAVLKRHALIGKATREGVKALGLTLFAPEDEKANSVTAIKAPEGIDGQQIVKTMREKYGITIAGGQSKLKGKIFRFGHCGYYDKFDILTTLAGLEMALGDLGYRFEMGAGVTAAEKIFAAG
ncbi:MAG: alanine--glyoxylate aminotransferase family protein [Actinomycetota bacterium]